MDTAESVQSDAIPPLASKQVTLGVAKQPNAYGSDRDHWCLTVSWEVGDEVFVTSSAGDLEGVLSELPEVLERVLREAP